MNYGYIYKTSNLINNRIYVGQHKGEFDYTYYGSGFLIKKALNKYGKNSFKLEVIVYAKDSNKLNELEKIYIKEYRNLLGKSNVYNICNGGQNICTPEIAKKIVATRRKNNSYKTGALKMVKTRALSGTAKSTPEQIIKRIETMKRNGTNIGLGKKAWKTRLLIGNATIGKNHPLWGTHRPPKVTKAISEKLTGLVQSKETIEKRVKKNTGQTRTLKERKRQSISALKRWKNTKYEKRGNRSHKIDCKCCFCKVKREN